MGGVFGVLPKRRGFGTLEVDSSMRLILIAIAIVVTILFGWLASKRIAQLKRILVSGPEVKGRIQAISFMSDRGRVEYQYEYEGQTYHSGNQSGKTARQCSSKSAMKSL